MTDLSPATITSDAAADQPDDGRAKRNVWVLAAAQGLGGLATMNIFATAALAGAQLAPDARWATLPVSTYIIGTALTTYPASMFMQRYGRRAGFMLGALGGLIGSLLAAYAILRGDFALFCLATFIAGSHQAFAQYYRFAATDVASPGFAPKAVSYVLAGALVGALFGPLIINHTRDLFAPVLFAGNYAATAALLAVSMGVLAFIDLPKPQAERPAATPFGALLRRKRLLVAMLAGMMAYGMMNLLMTATPLAMVGCGLSPDQASWVIQWHVLAMFAPSFFTGALIVRYGAERIIAIGLLLNDAAALAGMTG
ncbi:MAG TPA: MFS transporter, partial [Thermopetrobacter sp.]|nr:MFS transporter [Thermopetrobacter sp.]